MENFSDWIQDKRSTLQSNSNARKGARKGWNSALDQLEKSIENADNLGDVKDAINYLKEE